ncbi:MAG TPA: FixH family protein [Bryobacteraceae bacterium]|nr:FixH family protein [Bryobacteraceae bacterium]
MTSRDAARMVDVKVAILLFCGLTLFAQPVHNGNFTIRFEPTAILQSNAPIPFQIHVTDPNHHPVTTAKVEMDIEMTDHTHAQSYKAPSIGAGLYMAKPVFPVPGHWNVEVIVRRSDQESDSTLDFNIPE